MGCSSSKSASGGTLQTTLQAVGLEAKGDASSRCMLMMKEADEFNLKLTKAVKDLKILKQAATNACESVKVVLASPPPNVYDDASQAPALAAEPKTPLGGRGFATEQVTKGKTEFEDKVQPRNMEAWISKHDDAVVRQKQLNKDYDIMQSAKAKVANAEAKLNSLKGKLGGENPKVQHAERSLKAAQDALKIAIDKHTAEEQAQFVRLSALNSEAHEFGSIIKAGFDGAGNALLSIRDSVMASDLSPKEAVRAVSAASEAAKAAQAAATAAQAAAAAATGAAAPAPAAAQAAPVPAV